MQKFPYNLNRVHHSHDSVVGGGCDSVGYVSALLQDSCFTRADRKSSLTRIVKGSNDTAGRGREASVYGRINLLTGFTTHTNCRHRRCHCPVDESASLKCLFRNHSSRGSHEPASRPPLRIRQLIIFVFTCGPGRGARSCVSTSESTYSLE